MKFQEKKWSCGAAAVRNCLRSLGIRAPERQIRYYAETSKDFGTSEYGIINALKEWKCVVREYHFSSKNKAWIWLHETLQSGKPVIMAVDNWEHWIVAVGSMGDKVCIFDSANFKYNKYENGCHVWDKDKTLYKWWNDRISVESNNRIYAISVKK